MRGISRPKQNPPLRGNKGLSSQHATLFIHGVGVGSGPGRWPAFPCASVEQNMELNLDIAMCW